MIHLPKNCGQIWYKRFRLYYGCFPCVINMFPHECRLVCILWYFDKEFNNFNTDQQNHCMHFL